MIRITDNGWTTLDVLYMLVGLVIMVSALVFLYTRENQGRTFKLFTTALIASMFGGGALVVNELQPHAVDESYVESTENWQELLDSGFEFLVTNTGKTPLRGYSVYDMGVAMSCPDSILHPGESHVLKVTEDSTGKPTLDCD